MPLLLCFLPLLSVLHLSLLQVLIECPKSYPHMVQMIVKYTFKDPESGKTDFLYP